MQFKIDRDSNITKWGNDIAVFTGLPASDAVGRKYYDVLAIVAPGGRDAVAGVLKDGSEANIKGYNYTCLKGQSKVDVSISPLRGRIGNILGATIRISPLEACVAFVQPRHPQNTMDIEKAASTLAHGVRNPLNAIKGAVIYLKEKYSSEGTLLEFAGLMEEEITRLDNFISRFLSGSVSEEPATVVDVNETLRKIESIVSLQLKAKKINASFEYGPAPLLRISRFHLENSILNIINNSIEAMQNGGDLYVGCHTERHAGGRFGVIEIQDTGQGMPQVRESDLSSRRSGNGRGFGLSITNEILKSNGGHMEIKRRKENGTAVKLYLPEAGH